MTTKKKSTDVAPRDENASALALPFDYGEDAGVGQDELGIASGPPPFLRVLQKGSPQVDEQEEDYIPGAKPGMFINTATNEVVSGEEGVIFVPIGVRHVVDEWIPKDNGGGFIAEHGPEDEFVLTTIEANKKRTGKRFVPKPMTEDGHELIETFYVYGFVLDAPGGQVIDAVLMPITSIKIKPYRSGIDSLKTFARGCPIFAHQVRITTKYETRAAGNAFNIRVTPALGEDGQTTRDRRKASLIAPDSDLYQLAKLARAKFEGGEVEINRAAGAEEDVPAGDSQAAAKGVF